MKTRKDLKPGDSCIYTENGREFSGTIDRVTDYYLWVKQLPRSVAFWKDTGLPKVITSKSRRLFASPDEHEAHKSQRSKALHNKQRILHAMVMYGSHLSEAAVDRIVAILQDPASQRPA